MENKKRKIFFLKYTYLRQIRENEQRLYEQRERDGGREGGEGGERNRTGSHDRQNWPFPLFLLHLLPYELPSLPNNAVTSCLSATGGYISYLPTNNLSINIGQSLWVPPEEKNPSPPPSTPSPPHPNTHTHIHRDSHQLNGCHEKVRNSHKSSVQCSKLEQLVMQTSHQSFLVIVTTVTLQTSVMLCTFVTNVPNWQTQQDLYFCWSSRTLWYILYEWMKHPPIQLKKKCCCLFCLFAVVVGLGCFWFHAFLFVWGVFWGGGGDKE